MAKMIFINLPVADVEKSTTFYEAIGATKDPRFSVPGAGSAMVVSDTITFMILSHAHFMNFSPRPIADARTSAQVLLCLSEDSREGVDATCARVEAAGGRVDLNARDELGDFMYGRSFEDLDGHVFQTMWMDVEAAMKAWGGSAAGADAHAA